MRADTSASLSWVFDKLSRTSEWATGSQAVSSAVALAPMRLLLKSSACNPASACMCCDTCFGSPSPIVALRSSVGCDGAADWVVKADTAAFNACALLLPSLLREELDSTSESESESAPPPKRL